MIFPWTFFEWRGISDGQVWLQEGRLNRFGHNMTHARYAPQHDTVQWDHVRPIVDLHSKNYQEHHIVSTYFRRSIPAVRLLHWLHLLCCWYLLSPQVRHDCLTGYYLCMFQQLKWRAHKTFSKNLLNTCGVLQTQQCTNQQITESYSAVVSWFSCVVQGFGVDWWAATATGLLPVLFFALPCVAAWSTVGMGQLGHQAEIGDVGVTCQAEGVLVHTHTSRGI